MSSFGDTTLSARKVGSFLLVPADLAQDSRLRIRVWTTDEWAQHVEDMRATRRRMDTEGATFRDKVRLTWQIKRAARRRAPVFTWEAA